MKEHTPSHQPISVACPIDGPFNAPPYQLQELQPLLTAIQNEDLPQTEIYHFQRGSIRNDGYIDCCKQALGLAGTQELTQSLKQNTSIKGILFGTDGLGDEGATQVAEMLQANKHLETIYLGCNHIGSKGANQLSLALKQHPTVTGLWLKRNPIGEAGILAIADLLTTNTTLKSLDLVNTQMTLPSLQTLLNNIKEYNTTLERLYLGGNGLEREAASHIATFIQANKHIKALYLGVNQLLNEGAGIIAKALQKNHHLVELGMASNGIGNEGGEQLIQTLHKHPTLQHLDIGYSRSTRALGGAANTFNDDLAPLFARWIKAKTPLRFLSILHNEMTNHGFGILLEALTQNQQLQHLIVGKGFHGKMKARLHQLLQRNAINKGDYIRYSKEVKVIRSVYR